MCGWSMNPGNTIFTPRVFFFQSTCRRPRAKRFLREYKSRSAAFEVVFPLGPAAVRPTTHDIGRSEEQIFAALEFGEEVLHEVRSGIESDLASDYIKGWRAGARLDRW